MLNLHRKLFDSAAPTLLDLERVSHLTTLQTDFIGFSAVAHPRILLNGQASRAEFFNKVKDLQFKGLLWSVGKELRGLAACSLQLAACRAGGCEMGELCHSR